MSILTYLQAKISRSFIINEESSDFVLLYHSFAAIAAEEVKQGGGGSDIGNDDIWRRDWIFYRYIKRR